MKPLVSIITPTYNRAYILGTAIESIQAQTYPTWELIIIDDGSTDDTKQLVENFKDDRIKYLYQANTGQTKARNTGLSVAKGDWIAYLDSDNTLGPTYLEKMLGAIEKNPGTLWAFPKGDRFLELWINGIMLERIDQTDEFGETVSVQDIVYRKIHSDMNGFIHSKKIVDDGVRFDENFKKMEDWELFLQLAEKYPDNFLYVPENLYTYSQRYGGDGAVSNGSYAGWADTFERIHEKHQNDHLMVGQTWHPSRAEKWRRLAGEYEQGLIPPIYLYYFKNHWPKDLETSPLKNASVK